MIDNDMLWRRGSDGKEARIVKGRSLEVGYGMSCPGIKLKRSRTKIDEKKRLHGFVGRLSGWVAAWRE